MKFTAAASHALSLPSVPSFREDRSFVPLVQGSSLLEKSILETSLINTLLCDSYPEIGKFFHLEEMDPAILSKEQNKAIDSALSHLKRYILTVSLGIPGHTDEDQVNQAWKSIQKEHKQRLDNRKNDLKISRVTTAALLIALGIPYGILPFLERSS
ncbi:hypothetical protein ACTFIV_005138 [Dictyostelium citrinum]